MKKERNDIMKKLKISIIIILTILALILVGKPTISNSNVNMKKSLSNTYAQTKEEKIYYIRDLYANTKEESKIKHNTKYLQEVIDAVSEIGGGVIRLPAGTYYFASAGANVRNYEEYVIKPKNNVTLEGAGIDETNLNKCTILKPYGKVTLIKQGGLDMFYFNDYHDYGTETYLENANFKNFIIDGSETEGIGYNSSGKGFMLNLVKNCNYENIIVRNTEATGFGIDCTLNCIIKNCVAINCGRSAKETDVGASGFGIGTGYSNDESIHISNCTALGNKKFGFFFEHQGRFCGKNFDLYPAVKSQGFVVTDCRASGNMYDFGGARANDVTYENCVSDNSYVNKNVTNVAAFHFEYNSRRIHMVNCTSEQRFTDVEDSSKYYYDAVYWALNNAITSGISKTQFDPLNACTRAQAIVTIWRMAERPGDVVYSLGDLLNKQFENVYKDVPSNSYYVDAVKWAKEQGIISEATTFRPEDGCTRAEFITMLWRYAGMPKATAKSNFKDVKAGAYYEDAVNWAVSIGILKGTTTTTFSPNSLCRRADMITLLYRYSNSIENNLEIEKEVTTNNYNNSIMLQFLDKIKLAFGKFLK